MCFDYIGGHVVKCRAGSLQHSGSDVSLVTLAAGIKHVARSSGGVLSAVQISNFLWRVFTGVNPDEKNTVGFYLDVLSIIKKDPKYSFLSPELFDLTSRIYGKVDSYLGKCSLPVSLDAVVAGYKSTVSEFSIDDGFCKEAVRHAIKTSLGHKYVVLGGEIVDTLESFCSHFHEDISPAVVENVLQENYGLHGKISPDHLYSLVGLFNLRSDPRVLGHRTSWPCDYSGDIGFCGKSKGPVDFEDYAARHIQIYGPSRMQDIFAAAKGQFPRLPSKVIAYCLDEALARARFIRLGKYIFALAANLKADVVNAMVKQNDKFKVKVLRKMPEIEEISSPADVVSSVPLYWHLDLPRNEIERAVACAFERDDVPHAIIVNGKIANFREAFLKDVYNVILRSGGSLSSFDIARKLVSERTSVYKKALRIGGKFNDQTGKFKYEHMVVSDSELAGIASQIDRVVSNFVGTRSDAFCILPTGEINAVRHRTQCVRIKMDKDSYLTINLADASDVNAKVKEIRDANVKFLGNQKRMFSTIDPDDIESVFDEKLWKSILFFDDIWGEKFHTFLHTNVQRALYDISKLANRLSQTSLNKLSDRGRDEVGDRLRLPANTDSDPALGVVLDELRALAQQEFTGTTAIVCENMLMGLSTAEIAQNTGLSPREVSYHKRKIRQSGILRAWRARD